MCFNYIREILNYTWSFWWTFESVSSWYSGYHASTNDYEIRVRISPEADFFYKYIKWYILETKFICFRYVGLHYRFFGIEWSTVVKISQKSHCDLAFRSVAIDTKIALGRNKLHCSNFLRFVGIDTNSVNPSLQLWKTCSNTAWCLKYIEIFRLFQFLAYNFQKVHSKA